MAKQGRTPRHVPVTLHVYDFRAPALNGVLRQFGTGAFHCGVEVYGREWTFGNVSREGTGIFWNGPRTNQAHTYREAVSMGSTKLTRPEVDRLLCVMKAKWPAESYDLVKRNCCHFSNEFCKKLGVGSIPTWIMSLAAVGAAAKEDLFMGKQALDQVGLALVGAGDREERRGRDGYEAVSTNVDGAAASTKAPSMESALCMRPWKMCLLLVAVLGVVMYGGVRGAQHVLSRARSGAVVEGALVPEAPPPPELGEEAAQVAAATAADCSDTGEPVPLETRSWCCSTQGLWCVYTGTTTTTVQKYDCAWRLSSWSTTWSYEKQDWCCRHFTVGCTTTSQESEEYRSWPAPSFPTPSPAFLAHDSSTSAAYAASPAPTNSLKEYDCGESSQATWSEDEQKFCCLFKGLGCSAGSAAAYGWISPDDGPGVASTSHAAVTSARGGPAGISNSSSDSSTRGVRGTSGADRASATSAQWLPNHTRQGAENESSAGSNSSGSSSKRRLQIARNRFLA